MGQPVAAHCPACTTESASMPSRNPMRDTIKGLPLVQRKWCVAPRQHCKIYMNNSGGAGGIRARGRVSPTLDFESSSFNLSDTPPQLSAHSSEPRRQGKAVQVG